jgi:hypothetical protein
MNRSTPERWHKRRLLTATTLLLAIAVSLFANIWVHACGPDPPVAVFTATRHPDDAQRAFIAGELGVVLPSWFQRYLILSFRQLAALPVDTLARRNLIGPRLPDGFASWQKAWLEARAAVPGVEPIRRIETDRPIDPEEPWARYLNIYDDAFRNAVETLEKRIASFGAASPEVVAWLEAQDSVFANHGAGVSLPSAPAEDALPLVKADRAYQTAAAYFYAGRFDDAAAQFGAIAQDVYSPWRTLAPYLVARSSVRKATVRPGYRDVDTLSLARAESQLEEILADGSLAEIHEPAGRLLSYVQIRTRPEERLLEICLRLTAARLDESAVRDIEDLTWLFDRLDRVRVREFARENPEAGLADWVMTFQARDESSRQHAIAQWRPGRSLPWLVCAIAKTNPGDEHVDELLTAASALRPSAPGYATLAFHRARLLSVIDPDLARALLDTLLATDEPWPPSAQNLFLSMRFRLEMARDGFALYAPRKPVGVARYGTGSYVGQANAPLLEERAFPGPECLDADAVLVLNRSVSLEQWLTLLKEAEVPENIRAEIGVSGWARAELWEQDLLADSFARHVKELVPSLGSEMETYLAATDRASRRFAAAWTMLRFPGIRPRVTIGLGRRTPLAERDVFRDNWWCRTDVFREARFGRDAYHLAAASPSPLPVDTLLIARVVDQADRNKAARESKPFGAAPNVLGQAVLDWSAVQPDDARLPEALHLAVQATRYGCTDSLTTSVSKACFQTLHRLYPRSEWAEKTEYWY